VNCPQCGCNQIRAISVNSKRPDNVTRQRRCTGCAHVWYTVELPVSVAVIGWSRESGGSKPVLRVPVQLAVGSDAV